MICPKCEIGEISKVVFKKNEYIGLLCEYCGTVWMDHERIGKNSGHSIHTCSTTIDRDYVFSDIPKKDQDRLSVEYPRYK